MQYQLELQPVLPAHEANEVEKPELRMPLASGAMLGAGAPLLRAAQAQPAAHSGRASKKGRKKGRRSVPAVDMADGDEEARWEDEVAKLREAVSNTRMVDIRLDRVRDQAEHLDLLAQPGPSRVRNTYMRPRRG